MHFSQELIKVAQSVLANEFAGRRIVKPEDLSSFSSALVKLAPEAENLELDECRELIALIKENGIDLARGTNPRLNEQRNMKTQTAEENNNVLKAGDETNDSADNRPISEEQRKIIERSEALGAVNEVLNVYYPFKTINAVTDFDQFRLLFEKKAPRLASNYSDQQLKILLFQAGGTLIGRLLPQQERLAELKRRGIELTSPKPASVFPKTPCNEDPQFDDYVGGQICDNLGRERPVNDERFPLDSWGERMQDSSYDRYDCETDFSNGSRLNYGNSSKDDDAGKDGETFKRSFGYDEREADGHSEDNYYDAEQDYDQSYLQRRDDLARGRWEERNRYEQERYYDAGNAAVYEQSRPYGRQTFDDEHRERQENAYDDRYYGNGYDRRDLRRNDYRSYSPYQDEPYQNLGRDERERYLERPTRNARGNQWNSLFDRQRSEPVVSRSSEVGSANAKKTTPGAQPAAQNNAQPASDNAAQRQLLANYSPVVADILTKYFPGKIISTPEDVKTLRRMLAQKCPKLNCDLIDEKLLRKLVSYGGGTYSVSNARASAQNMTVRTSPEKLLYNGAREILKTYFPNGVVFVPDGLQRFSNLFYAKFPGVKLKEDTLKRLISKAEWTVWDRALESEEESAKVVYRKIAGWVLRKFFPNTLFQRDYSDFGRFCAKFREEAGGQPTAISDDEIKQVFLEAGGRLAEERLEQTNIVYSRPTIVKRVICEDFGIDGFDSNSPEDIRRFRLGATRYGNTFEEEDDSKLTAIIARTCIGYKGKLYSLPKKDMEKIKSLVANCFAVGGQMIYYKPFFEKNSDWLRKGNVISPGLLKAYLMKSYSTYLFYPTGYFEPRERQESDRVKVALEIMRVWGGDILLTSEENGRKGSQTYRVLDGEILLSADGLAERLYIAKNRIQYAMELDPGTFKPMGDGFFKLIRDAKVNDSEELDDLFDEKFNVEFSEKELDPESVEQVNEVGDDASDDVSSSNDKSIPTQLSLFDFSDSVESMSKGRKEEEATVGEGNVSVGKTKETRNKELLAEAADFIREKVKEWFDAGGKIVYYKAFWRRWEENLKKFEFESYEAFLKVAVSALKGYFRSEEYVEPEKNNLELDAKIKADLDKNWSRKGPARRILELVDLIYVTKDALAPVLENDPDYETSSANGFWVRKPKKVAQTEVKEVKKEAKEVKKTSKTAQNKEKLAEAAAFIYEKVKTWFDEGGVFVYYEAFWDRWQEDLKKLGVGSLDDFLKIAPSALSEFFCSDEYVEPKENDMELGDKIKMELERVWSLEKPARRTYELVELTYITSDALVENLKDDPEFEYRSNGYWVRALKKVEDGKRRRRVLQKRRRPPQSR